MKLSPAEEAKCMAMADRIDGKPVGAVEQIVADTISEMDFMRAVTDLAEANGWKWHHQTISKRSKEGWPDLVLLRHRCVVAELKVGSNTADAAQLSWLEAFQAAGIDAHLWYPNDMDEIRRILTTRRPA